MSILNPLLSYLKLIIYLLTTTKSHNGILNVDYAKVIDTFVRIEILKILMLPVPETGVSLHLFKHTLVNFISIFNILIINLAPILPHLSFSISRFLCCYKIYLTSISNYPLLVYRKTTDFDLFIFENWETWVATTWCVPCYL